ncbi:MAG TPA: hypothetical protein VGB26_14560 [Nitrospiria bacterium]|jgi:hypothetical protein
MKIRRKVFFCVWPLLFIFLLPPHLWGHEVVGEVTPLMLHADHIITFIKKGRGEEAVRMAERVYEDFQENGRMGWEAGLRTSSIRVDETYHSTTHEMISRAIVEKNSSGLKKGIEWLSFLLMLEKFDRLHNMMEKGTVALQTQITIFWLGRNYFSYLLEPTMGEIDPIEEKRLDRLLDQMLYSLEDKKWEQFRKQKKELIQSVVRFFQFRLDRVIPKEME